MHASHPEDLTALDWNTLVTAEVPYYTRVLFLNPIYSLKEKETPQNGSQFTAILMLKL
jgi:hypothetical protein